MRPSKAPIDNKLKTKKRNQQIFSKFIGILVWLTLFFIDSVLDKDKSRYKSFVWNQLYKKHQQILRSFIDLISFIFDPLSTKGFVGFIGHHSLTGTGQQLKR